MGRPTKLTPERQQVLVDAIRAGNYYETACAAAGIEYQTFRNWMVRGQEGRGARYVEFFEAITRAEHECEQEIVQLWRDAMPDDWRAAQMFLERRHRDRWGPVQKMELDQRVQGRMEVEHGVDVASANTLLAALGFGPVGATESGDAGDGPPGDSAPTSD